MRSRIATEQRQSPYSWILERPSLLNDVVSSIAQVNLGFVSLN